MVKKFVYVIFAGILLFGCNAEDLDFDNIKGPNLSGTFGFPLGEVKYTLREIVENVGGDSLDIEEDSATSVLTLLYYDTLAYSAPDDMVQIVDIVDGGSIPVPAATGPGPVNINGSFAVLYNPSNGEKLDSVFYNSGDLEVTVTSTSIGDLAYSVTFENTRNLGTTPESAVILSGNISGAGADTQSQNLANHVTRLTDPSDSNKFVVQFDGTLTLGAGESTIGTETIRIDFSYRNQTFQTIYGKFGQDSIQVGNNEIDLGFFNDIGGEGITFGNPTMSFDFRNSFGLPINIDLSGMFGDDSEGGPQTFLTGNIVSSPPRILKSTELGVAMPSGFEINSANSNLVQILANSPKRLVFDIEGVTNPKAEDTLLVNFLQPASRIDTYVEMKIPMELKLENLEQTDTISLGGGIDISDVDSAFLRVHTLNELPFSALLSMDIQDSVNNSLHEVSNNLIIKAPFINVNGFVTDPSGATVDIPLSKEGLDALSVGSHIVMKVLLNTPKSVTSRDLYVKFLGDYSLEIKVGIGGKLNVDL